MADREPPKRRRYNVRMMVQIDVSVILYGDEQYTGPAEARTTALHRVDSLIASAGPSLAVSSTGAVAGIEVSEEKDPHGCGI